MKNQATFKEYTVTIADSGSVEVYKQFANTLGALREIADLVGFDIEEKWSTRTTGAKLIKHLGDGDKTIIVGEYIVTQEESGSISVAKIYSNTKGALREIAEIIGFEIDGKWNTRQIGAKVVDAINSRV